MKNASTAISRRLSDPEFMQLLLKWSYAVQGVTALAVVGLVGDRIWWDHHPPTPKYFYTDGKHTPHETQPLDGPVMSDDQLRLWTAGSVVAAYSLNFKDYREQATRASAHFTKPGWDGFGRAFIETGNFEKMKRARLVLTAVPERAPTIRERDVIDGRLAWKIELPLLVTYENENSSMTQHLLVTVRVMRQIETEHPDGVAIDQINAPPA